MRRFELGERHWTVEVETRTVRFVWGDPVQRHERRFATHAEASAYAEKQIEVQRAKGYVEVAPPAPPPPPPSPIERPLSRSIRFEIAAETRTAYRRYPKPARFRALEQRDREVTIVEGELATPAQAAPRHATYPTIAQASAAYETEVRAAREDRFRQVSSSTEARVLAIEPRLEEQCWQAPDDPAPWTVYADWLLERDDPLGHLATSPSEATARSWFARELEELGVETELLELERRHGVPRRVTIRMPVDPDSDPERLAEAARAVRASSVGRFVDELRFGLAAFSDRNDWAPTLRALASAPHPERIRALSFDAYESTDCEISWAAMGDLTGLFAPFPNLQHLHLRSGAGGVLGELELPSLRTLIRESGGLADAEIASITSARCPRLDHLEIWFGSPAYGATSTVGSIRNVLEGTRFPALRHLGIVNCAWVEHALEAVAHSALLPRLTSLDLSRGTLARRGVTLLRRLAPAFRHLASIDLSQNLLDPDEVAQVREVLDNVIVADQRPREDDDYVEDDEDDAAIYYVAVGE